MMETLWSLKSHLRQLMHSEFGGQWSETVSLVFVTLSDPEALKTMQESFAKYLSASQLIASLAYLASVECPKESRLNSIDVAFLLWMSRPHHHEKPNFRQGLEDLLELGKLEEKFFSLSQEFSELDLKKLERLNQSLLDWLPLFVFSASNEKNESLQRVA